MARLRKVTRFVDAMHSQRRLIVHLECGHNVSFTDRQITAMPWQEALLLKAELEHAETLSCPYCADLPKGHPSPAEVRWPEPQEERDDRRPLSSNPEDYSD